MERRRLLPSPPQHLSSRYEDLLLGRGTCSHDGCRLHQGLFGRGIGTPDAYHGEHGALSSPGGLHAGQHEQGDGDAEEHQAAFVLDVDGARRYDRRAYQARIAISGGMTPSFARQVVRRFWKHFAR